MASQWPLVSLVAAATGKIFCSFCAFGLACCKAKSTKAAKNGINLNLHPAKSTRLKPLNAETRVLTCYPIYY